jgi:hypothetical protein
MTTASSSRSKVARHRESLRSKGLRPIQIWVPDPRNPAFQAEAERQSHLVAAARDEAEIEEFLERVTDWDG